MNVTATKRETFTVNLTEPSQAEIDRQQERIEAVQRKHQGDHHQILNELGLDWSAYTETHPLPRGDGFRGPVLGWTDAEGGDTYITRYERISEEEFCEREEHLVEGHLSGNLRAFIESGELAKEFAVAQLRKDVLFDLIGDIPFADMVESIEYVRSRSGQYRAEVTTQSDGSSTGDWSPTLRDACKSIIDKAVNKLESEAWSINRKLALFGIDESKGGAA